MSAQNARVAILNTLMQLKKDPFRDFCGQLTDQEERPCIFASEVEGRTRRQVMELLVSRCGETGAVRRTVNALRGIGSNNEAKLLQSKYKLQAEAKRKVTDEHEPTPAPKPLGPHPQKQLKSSQKVSKTLPKARSSGKATLLFGKHKDKSFRWLLQNDLQYAAYVVGSHQMERENGKSAQTELMKNKDALAEFVSCFPDAVEAVHFYREGLAPVGFGKYKEETRLKLYKSSDEDKKEYVNWIRSIEETGAGSKMVAMIKYICYYDQKAAVQSCSKAGPQKKKRGPPDLSSQPAAMKKRF